MCRPGGLVGCGGGVRVFASTWMGESGSVSGSPFYLAILSEWGVSILIVDAIEA